MCSIVTYSMLDCKNNYQSFIVGSNQPWRVEC